LKSAPVILSFGSAALAIFFCFGDNDFDDFLQAPLQPGFEQPHPQPLHIYLLSFFLVGFFLALANFLFAAAKVFIPCLSFGFIQPQVAHIYLLTFFLAFGFDLGTPFAGTQLGTFLPFFIFIPT
jgi:hypothetical protein